ncbi:MAG: DUF429 domain-containing protein [Acidimicrobiales bacterium]
MTRSRPEGKATDWLEADELLVESQPADLEVAGIDGCPGGWAIARLRGDQLRVERADSLVSIFAETRSGNLAVAAIDMPIGLLADRSRSSDAAARKLLGPRRSSVFATPVRSTLQAEDYADACAMLEGSEWEGVVEAGVPPPAEDRPHRPPHRA